MYGPSSISSDGRFVAFSSYASNLVANDTNGNLQDVFVRDRQTGTTELVSLSILGAQGSGSGYQPSMSSDGRFVAYQSPEAREETILVRDRQAGTTLNVVVSSSGAQGDGYSSSPSMSSDGRFVAFDSDARNLVSGDTNRSSDIFVHELSR